MIITSDICSEIIPDNKVKTNFKESIMMSTYLVAIVVSDFVYLEQNATTDNPTLLRTYAPANYINQTRYALTETVPILKAITKYLETPFAISKLDQVAIWDSEGM